MDVDVLFRIPGQREEQLPDRNLVHDHAVGGGLGCRLRRWQKIAGGADGGWRVASRREHAALGEVGIGLRNDGLVRAPTQRSGSTDHQRGRDTGEGNSATGSRMWRARHAVLGAGTSGGRFPKIVAFSIAEGEKASMVPDAWHPPELTVIARSRAESPTPNARKGGHSESLPADWRAPRARLGGSGNSHRRRRDRACP